MITRLEELSLNAWPAFQTLALGGWLARFAEGYTRRANSVAPLYAAASDAEERVSAVEGLYAARGLPAIFKLTAASRPAGLDELLARRGYRKEAETSVQTLDLRDWSAPPQAGCMLSAAAEPAWSAAFARLSGLEPQKQALHERILAAIQPRCVYAALLTEGQIVACGLGVLQDGFIGLYDIVVAEEQRRRGYGERLVRELLGWGKAAGAHSAYLQVMLNNPPALRLYARVGYQPAYRYWYRVRAG